MHKRRYIVMILAAVCVGALVCHGRIFARWGGRAQSTRAMVAAGGTSAYEAAVTVNGGHGRVAVLSFDGSTADVVSKLCRVLGLQGFENVGGTMVRTVTRTGNTVMTLLVIRPSAIGRTVVFKLEQSAAESELSGKPPDRHMLRGAPAYPGSIPTFFASDDEFKMGLAVARTMDAPGAIHDFYESALTGQGWTPTMPVGVGAGRHLATHAMVIYSRNREVCCVFVDQPEPGRESRITLLHKQPGMK